MLSCALLESINNRCNALCWDQKQPHHDNMWSTRIFSIQDLWMFVLLLCYHSRSKDPLWTFLCWHLNKESKRCTRKVYGKDQEKGIRKHAMGRPCCFCAIDRVKKILVPGACGDQKSLRSSTCGAPETSFFKKENMMVHSAFASSLESEILSKLKHVETRTFSFKLPYGAP